MTPALPCPLCSAPQLKLLAEPQWSPAWRTSQKRGMRCAFLSGCRHIAAHGGWKIVELPNAEALLTTWNAEAERLFAASTAHWEAHERAVFRAALGYPQAA